MLASQCLTVQQLAACDRGECLAQAGAGGIQEFDLLTGCKLGGTEGSVQPLCLAYSSDGSRLIGLLQVRQANVAWPAKLHTLSLPVTFPGQHI